MTVMSETSVVPDVVGPESLPPEVEFILSALEAANAPGRDRRHHERRRYRTKAALKLFSDDAKAPPWNIFVRDASSRGLGFITRHRLPLGYGGTLTITTPLGKSMRVDCTLVRCREAASGWFEGSMYFNREQAAFAPDLLETSNA